jgi:uncharacterized glyoxalase superfamily protein PhnB
MIYSNLNDISLYKFNKILLGDYNAIIIKRENETDTEIKHTCEQLISEYSLILGNESARSVCIMYEEALNHERMLLIAKTGYSMKDLIAENAIEVALEASRYLGYNGDEDKVFDFLKSKITYYEQRFGLSKIQIEKYNKENKSDKTLTEKDLANERAMLMMAGVNIDQHKISAMGYACLLKAKMEEIKAQKRALKK